MAVPAGALQRAVLVAVPLGLVVLIFVTTAIVGQTHPQATDIPFLLVEVTGQPWNGTVNESALFYVRSALGVPLYDYLAINVTGVDPMADLRTNCGGLLGGGVGNWSCTEAFVPSLWVKIPVVHESAVNVTAVAVREDTLYRYTATITFSWDDSGWILRVWPEDVPTPTIRTDTFSASMRREVTP
ncbi:MAG TPA: hypothetical protein VGR51_03535 [Thermoplasmata archaeon]|jgi:hypothetical protein|nr:hypothetical protein [Thermoplasmata archaeon]